MRHEKHGKLNQRGLILTEILTYLLVAWGVTTVAKPFYEVQLIRAQVSEAFPFMDLARKQALNNMSFGRCAKFKKKHWSSSAKETEKYFQKGNYGGVSINGTLNTSHSPDNKTGCQITYTFDSEQANEAIRDKKLVADIMRNGSLQAVQDGDAATRLSNLYLPLSFKSVTTSEDDVQVGVFEWVLDALPQKKNVL